MPGEKILLAYLLAGAALVVVGATAYRSDGVREKALRLHHRGETHQAAKAVALLSLAVIVGVFLDDASVFDSTVHYYAAIGAYLGGGGLLFTYANVEVLAALAVISRHPDARSYEDVGVWSYLRRSGTLFADWRYLVNEYHGGAVFAFWLSGALLLFGGFLGLVGPAFVIVVSLVALTLGMASVVAGALIGWTRSVSHSTGWEADDHERVDALVEEAREDVENRSGNRTRT